MRTSASLGELDSTGSVPVSPLHPAPGELEELQREWEVNKTPIQAANLIDVALVLDRPYLGAEAAKWLIDNGNVSTISLQLAEQMLSTIEKCTESNVAPPILTREERYRLIASYRRRLRSIPHDPLLWVELAREYSALGQLGSARKSLLTAVSLAPNDRFVLRSASRFFLHVREYDRAHAVLRNSDLVISDPWIMAAEIAAAEANAKHSRFIKRGVQILEAKRFSPHHISELASSIGTLEHEAGNSRKGKRLFSQALIDPTENAVAQAAWVERHLGTFRVPRDMLQAPRAFEARAWDAVQEGAYDQSVELATQWLADEPFSTRPALFGSWTASMALEDYATAITLLNQALIANPNDPRIMAQLIYCKASIGKLSEAEDLLSATERAVRTNPVDLSITEWDVLLDADRGLLSYKRGQFDIGRDFYVKAIRAAEEHNFKTLAASAQLHHAHELAIAHPGSVVDGAILRRAVEVFPIAVQGILEKFVERIQGHRAVAQ